MPCYPVSLGLFYVPIIRQWALIKKILSTQCILGSLAIFKCLIGLLIFKLKMGFLRGCQDTRGQLYKYLAY